MRSARLLRWTSSTQCFRTRPQTAIYSAHTTNRHIATQTITAQETQTTYPEPSPQYDTAIIPQDVLQQLPSPPVAAARTSAKLGALHARINLPSKVPTETLARCLVHPSADPDARFNNTSMSLLGSDILSAYTSEYIISQHPRLPLIVVYSAMNALVGAKALAAVTREFGVLPAAAPGGEVDPGYLQYKHTPPAPQPEKLGTQYLETEQGSREKWRRGISNRVIYDNEFGEQRQIGTSFDDAGGVTLESASASFTRAVTGAIYIHAGRRAAKQFFKDHIMSRKLDIGQLMAFRRPTQDISRLCAREGFLPPVSRILSETGRASRHPVFVVGVFSGKEKLGEAAGSSLDEARTRAAVAALKAWYLYSPLDWQLPSDIEEGVGQWRPGYVDAGDIVV